MYYLNNNNPARLGHPGHSHELCPACQCLCKVKLWFIAAAPEAEFLCDGNMKNNHHLPTQSLIWKLILHCTHGIWEKCQTKPTKYNQQNIETTKIILGVPTISKNCTTGEMVGLTISYSHHSNDYFISFMFVLTYDFLLLYLHLIGKVY